MELNETVSLFLQIVGGVLYLLNKIFFARYEWLVLRRRQQEASRALVLGWWTYIAGLLPWVVVFASWRNWIAALLELSALPSMVIGLRAARQIGTRVATPRLLDHIANICIVLGVALSFRDLGVMQQFTQWLEIGLVVGFLAGTYQLAHQRISGYWWLVFMHVSCAWLMYEQHSPWLVAHQILSIGFVAFAIRIRQLRKQVVW